MTERIGVCGGCGANYKIPQTFQGTKAKCKKCDGVVEIPAAAGAPPAKPAPAPAATPATARTTSRAGSKSGVGKSRASSASGRRGAAEAEASGSRAGGRRRGGERETKKDNTMLYVGIGAAVILVGALGFFLLKKDKPVSDTVASASDKAGQADDAIKAPEAEVPTEAQKPIEEAPIAPPPVVEAPKPAAEPEPEPVALNPVLAFDAFPKPPTLSDDEWTALNDAVRKGYIESSRPKDRKAAKDVVTAQGPAAVPALINGLNGLDLSSDTDFPNISTIVLTLQEVSKDVLKIPFETDLMDREKNQERNLKVLDQLFKLWAKNTDPEKYAAFVEKVSKAAAKVADESDG